MSSAVTRVVVTALIVVEVLGSTTSAAQDSSSHAPYVARARSGTQGEVRVSAAALSADESAAVYGSPLADKLIQPVWIEVENNEDVPYWMMFAGLDPNFFPASEAAEAMAAGGSSRRLEELDRRFKELAFRNPVPPGSMVAGFVLTNLHEGVKLLQIDLFADRRSRSFSFLAVVPGLRTDYSESRVFRRDIAADGGVVNFTDDPEFRAALEALPCCATNKDGSRNGDPLNLVIIGGIDDAFASLVRRGWSPTEATWKGLGDANDEFRSVSGTIPVRTDQQPVPVWPAAGHRAAEGARQYPSAQSSAPLAQRDALPGPARLGGSNQPRHRQPADHPFADPDHSQDRSRRGRGRQGPDGRSRLLPGSSCHRTGQGYRCGIEERPA